MRAQRLLPALLGLLPAATANCSGNSSSYSPLVTSHRIASTRAKATTITSKSKQNLVSSATSVPKRQPPSKVAPPLPLPPRALKKAPSPPPPQQQQQQVKADKKVAHFPSTKKPSLSLSNETSTPQLRKRGRPKKSSVPSSAFRTELNEEGDNDILGTEDDALREEEGGAIGESDGGADDFSSANSDKGDYNDDDVVVDGTKESEEELSSPAELFEVAKRKSHGGGNEVAADDDNDIDSSSSTAILSETKGKRSFDNGEEKEDTLSAGSKRKSNPMLDAEDEADIRMMTTKEETSAEGGEGEEDVDEVEEGDADSSNKPTAASETQTKEEDELNHSEDGVVDSTAEPDSKLLSARYPALAAEYLAAQRSNPTPMESIQIDSGKVVAWKCSRCSHEWRSAVFLRCALKSPCPACHQRENPTLAVSHRHLLREWDPVANDIFVDPAKLPQSSTLSAHWRCAVCQTSFEARVRSRVTGKAGCPTCAVNAASAIPLPTPRKPSATAAAALRSKATADQTPVSSTTTTDTPPSTTAAGNAPIHLTRALVRQEWHPVKNGDLQFDGVPPMTRAWWMCSFCGHEWETTVANRLVGKKRSCCPECKSVNPIVD